jgi:hypothetical protein
MTLSATQVKSRGSSHDPSGRSYQPLYRAREVNHCPGCGRAHWIVGRISAECAFCATALPFAAPAMFSALPVGAND